MYVMSDYDTFIVLIDQDDGSYNANVWFELGLIATQKNKTIILISKDYNKRFPFYISDIDVVIIDIPMYIWFDNNRNSFDILSTLTDLKNPGIVKECAVGEYPKSWIGRSQAA